MGNSEPKKIIFNMDKPQIEILCLKLKSHLEIQAGKKTNECKNREKEFSNMIHQPNRFKSDER